MPLCLFLSWHNTLSKDPMTGNSDTTFFPLFLEGDLWACFFVREAIKTSSILGHVLLASPIILSQVKCNMAGKFVSFFLINFPNATISRLTISPITLTADFRAVELEPNRSLNARRYLDWLRSCMALPMSVLFTVKDI